MRARKVYTKNFFIEVSLSSKNFVVFTAEDHLVELVCSQLVVFPHNTLISLAS
jgi:hypothetical protein